MTNLIIYHANCTDGLAAAWVARRFFSLPSNAAPVELVPASYGEDPPDVTGKNVWILDFSYPRKVLLAMAEKAASIKVLDHHKTAQEDLADLPFAHFNMERSGAGLAWEHFFPKYDPPYWLLCVEDRDLWRHKKPDSKLLYYAINAKGLTFETLDWVHEDYPRWLLLGDALAQYAGQIIQRLVNSAYSEEWEGHNFWMVNCPPEFTSEVAEVLYEKEDRPVLLWSVGKNGAYYSLRSRRETGIDVAEIARRHGGGGHKNAAAFKMARCDLTVKP